MKYLIVVLVVLVVVWLLLRSGKRAASPPASSASAKASTQDMLPCSHCGVHLPKAEALLDDRGAFCSEAHRLAGPR
jgi:uncharacterized protein